jgi:hypothetical protein
MEKRQSNWEATYRPQSFKTFEGALDAFFKEECPEYGGPRVRLTLVRAISSMVSGFFPETSHLRQGQTVWTTVHKDEKGAYGKKIRDTRLQNVVLTLVAADDASKRADGMKLKDLKVEAAARLCKESFEQNGVLTNAEVALLLKMSPQTAGKYIRQWETEHEELLPRRGTIHDMGPTLTHKRIIIEKLFVEKHTVQQVSRETYHSLPAIQRYIGTFKKVLLCVRKGFKTEETAYAVGITPRLVKQYEEIIEEYRNRNFVLDSLLKYEVQIESKWDQFLQELTNAH